MMRLDLANGHLLKMCCMLYRTRVGGLSTLVHISPSKGPPSLGNFTEGLGEGDAFEVKMEFLLLDA